MLACSLSELKARDQKTLLVMSDASGPSTRTTDDGYLTGYPLTDSGFYALARTWSAPEMSRPGCVWTHTLLIDFSDLAAVSQLELLAEAFERPSQGSLGGYIGLRTLSLARPSDSSRSDLGEFYDQVLRALYSHPRSRVFIPLEIDAQKENAILKVWSQQWPRLRRSFRFCTQAFADRSLSDGEQFDLQFGPIAVSARVRGNTEPQDLSAESSFFAWGATAIRDLTDGVPGLRSFMRTAGADLSDGRVIFAPLVTIFNSLVESQASGHFDARLLPLIEKSIPANEGKSIRSAIVNAIVESAQSGSESAIEYALDNAHLIEPETVDVIAWSFAQRVWTNSPSRFVQLLGTSNVTNNLIRAISQFPVDVVVSGIIREPSIAATVLQLRPDLLGTVEFWQQHSQATEIGFRLLSLQKNGLDAALKSMILADRVDVASGVVKEFGSERALNAALEIASAQHAENPRPTVLSWIRAATREPSILAGVLASGRVKNKGTLLTLARVTTPDSVPNEYGHDPWWIAVQRCSGDLSTGGNQFFAAFILSRALGFSSRSQAELAAYAFDDVYLPALKSHLSKEVWQVLEDRLPGAKWGLEWDQCRRLRSAIVDLFVDRDLQAQTFCKLTKSDQVFQDLVSEAADTRRGRNYLRRLLDQSSADSKRARMVGYALD